MYAFFVSTGRKIGIKTIFNLIIESACALNCSCDGPRGRGWDLLCGVDCEDESPEAVIVGAL